MDLQPHVEHLQRQLAAAAEASGAEARVLGERLIAALDAATRLTLLDVLTAAAEEITCELAPGSVEVRLRGRDPQLVVTPAPLDPPLEDPGSGEDDASSRAGVVRGLAPSGEAGEGKADEGDQAAISRINLRMPDRLKARIERAAGSEGLSVNAWLVRAATAALPRSDPDHRDRLRAPKGSQRYTGWGR